MVKMLKDFSEIKEKKSEVILSEMDDLVISVKTNVAELAKSFSGTGGCGSCSGCQCKIVEE